jgi:transposase-like protein
VITNGDLAMQSAIISIFPRSNHSLCTWHIERNIIQHFHNSKVGEEFRKLLYDCCTEVERKWEDFIERNKVSDRNSWVHEMYKMRRLWCAAYQVGKRFLGLKSNQCSESLNSKLHTHLDSRMTLFDLLQHYEHCLSNMGHNEAMLDSVALHSTPFIELDAGSIESHGECLYTHDICLGEREDSFIQ